MMVTVMQVLDTSVTNVALPHMQGSLSAGIEEMSWVLTSYLAANAVIIPATGWLSARFGRRRFFLICTVLFAGSSFLSGIAPNLEFLVAMRVLQGLGGGPVIPMAQAIMWEIFPLRQRGTAMAVWGVGIMMAPILGPTVGACHSFLALDLLHQHSHRLHGVPDGQRVLFDSRSPRSRQDRRAVGRLMVVGFGACSRARPRERRLVDSDVIVALVVPAICALVGFLVRS
jgi:MFS family permease